ncbi:MAG: hypothetical protein SNJ56_06640 [Termitinemataceae bacterium]
MIHRQWQYAFVVTCIVLCGSCGSRSTDQFRDSGQRSGIQAAKPDFVLTEQRPYWFEILLSPQATKEMAANSPKEAEAPQNIKAVPPLYPVQDPSQSQVLPYSPWTMAPRVIALHRTGSFVVAGINRSGFLVFKETPDSFLELYCIEGDDPALRSSSSRAMILTSGHDLGLTPTQQSQTEPQALYPVMWFSWDTYFGTVSGSVPDRLFSILDLTRLKLITLDPVSSAGRPGQEGEAVRWPQAFLNLQGRLSAIEALNLGNDGRWYLKALLTNDFRSYYVSSGFSEPFQEISLGTYQRAMIPRPYESLPKPLKLLLRSFQDSRASTHYPLLSLVQQDVPDTMVFAADPRKRDALPMGGGETEIIKFYGYYDQAVAVIILGDGRGVLARSALEAFALPPLPEGFTYTGLVVLPSWVIASWEEQEAFAVGAAGILVQRVE